MDIAAIVLAAGRSERMGCNKLLLRLNDQTVIDRILTAVADARVRETVVVLGYKPQQLIDVIAARRNAVRTVINRDYLNGMTSSFQKGLQALYNVDATFLILGDQPMLDTSLLTLMIDHLRERTDALIVSPKYKGKSGHPVLFHRTLFNEILSLEKNATIRDIIHRHADVVLTIDAPEWTTMDMDTPDDYVRVCALMRPDRH